MKKYSQNMKDIEDGIESLLTNALKLHKHDEVYIIYQDSLCELINIIEKKSDQLGIISKLRKFNIKVFYNKNFPQSIIQELNLSDTVSGILLLIEWSPESSGGRLSLLRSLMNNHKSLRIASMPGMELDYISYCDCDYELISRECKSVFESLNMFSLAKITTIKDNGDKCVLSLDLGKYRPIISSGIIEEGKWGNVPSGETFCMPEHVNCNGDIILRGSIPNYPLKNGEWIYFNIVDGKIKYTSILATSDKLSSRFKNLFFDKNGDTLNKNGDIIAELGIGVNENIRKLTGKPLFDEKKIGTIHLAFGSNNQFNGPIDCKTHHDLVFTDVTFELFNKERFYSETVIEKGEYKFNRKISRLNTVRHNRKLYKDISVNYKVENNEVKIKYKTNRNNEISTIVIPSKFYTILKFLRTNINEIDTLDVDPNFFEDQSFYKLQLHKILNYANG